MNLLFYWLVAMGDDFFKSSFRCAILGKRLILDIVNCDMICGDFAMESQVRDEFA